MALRKTLLRFVWPAAIVLGFVGLRLMSAAKPVIVETAVVGRGKIEEYVTEEAETQLDVERLVTADPIVALGMMPPTHRRAAGPSGRADFRFAATRPGGAPPEDLRTAPP